MSDYKNYLPVPNLIYHFTVNDLGEALPPSYIRYGGLKTHPIINSILPLYSNINRIQTFFTPIEINQLPSSWWTRAYV